MLPPPPPPPREDEVLLRAFISSFLSSFFLIRCFVETFTRSISPSPGETEKFYWCCPNGSDFDI